MTRTVAVFGSSQTGLDSDGMGPDAVEVGARLASAGLAVVTGGYGGTMEAVSLGAADAGGQVIGVTAPTLVPGPVRGQPLRPRADRGPEPRSANRRHDATRPDATLSLAGSLGTATELLMAWNINHIRRQSGQPSPPECRRRRAVEKGSRCASPPDRCRNRRYLLGKYRRGRCRLDHRATGLALTIQVRP